METPTKTAQPVQLTPVKPPAAKTPPAVLVSHPGEPAVIANRDWSIVHGTNYTEKPYMFDYMGNHYFGFFLGAAYQTHEKDGAAAVMGITKDHKLELIHLVLCPTVFDLLHQIVFLREQCGGGLVAGHMDYVIGEEDRYQSICDRFTMEVEKLGKHGVYFKAPAGITTRSVLSMYLSHLRQALQAERFDLKKNAIAIDELRVVNNEIAQKGRYQDYPVPALLGGMVHTILYEGRDQEVYHADSVVPAKYDFLKETG